MGQTYKDVDRDVFLKRNEEAQRRQTYSGGPDYFSPAAGKAGDPNRYIVRIMPPHVKMDDVFVEAKMHFLPSKEVNAKTGRVIPIGINCLSPFGKDCPACKYVERLRKDAKNEDDEKQAAALERQAKDRAAKLRIFANVVDITDAESARKGVLRWAFGPDVEKQLRACFFDDNGQFRNITHPRAGRDLIVKVQKQAKTDFNDWDIRAKESDSAVADMEWLDNIVDLSELAREPKVEDIELALRGERPTRASSPPSSSSPSLSTSSSLSPSPSSSPSSVKTEEPVVSGKRGRRKAAADAEDEPTGGPYAAARKRIAESIGKGQVKHFTVADIEPERVEKIRKPSCYGKEWELTDETCQSCVVVHACLSVQESLPI